MNPLGNLAVRSNVLPSDTYQVDVRTLTVFELRDTDRRVPNLAVRDGQTPTQREEWRRSLFWGNPQPPLADDWTNAVAVGLDFDDALAALEERPDAERAFELLVLLRWSPSQDPRAAEYDGRAVAVLLRDEFRLTRELIADRVNQLLGRPPRS